MLARGARQLNLVAKPVALEDERLPSEEPPVPNARFLLGAAGASGGYRQAPTRLTPGTGPTNPSKFHIFWDKAYFATAVGALRLSIMGCMMFAILLLSFFKGDSCHIELHSPHSETTTTAPSSGSVVDDGQHWIPSEASSEHGVLLTNASPPSRPSGLPISINVHLFICFVTFAAMLAWIAVDNSSFNYRFPFKWKLFRIRPKVTDDISYYSGKRGGGDCCVYCKLILLLLVSASVVVNARNHGPLAGNCKDSIGKLDMAIAFSFLAVVIMLTLITLRFFDKDAPQPSRSASNSSNPLQWIHRRFSRSKQTQILLQQVA
ncbi:hypothetical protein BIW11_01115 [Tropilaelaps mercedesae]|uniref:Uncharacterized protein n=1 Tax=Tropilaelaps mercedesae TaxID=418985 RepID=A0A1V9XJT0_9ACAR|nr:hypothetical protein BIW11_01115 [Tropilaelaps mercedesae]